MTDSLFRNSFKTYESARTVVKRLVRVKGSNSDTGYTKHGFSIISV